MSGLFSFSRAKSAAQERAVPDPTQPPLAEQPPPGFWRQQLARTFWRSMRRNTRWTRSMPPLGRSFLAALGISLVFCVDPSRRGGRLVFAFCLGALVVGAVWARMAPMRALRVRRDLPDFVRAGTPFPYTLTLTNSSSRALARLDGRDGSQLIEPRVHSWATGSWWADRSLSRFDRIVGYPRWLSMAEQTESVAGERFFVARIAPGASERLPATGLCRQRGLRSFSGIWAGARDPFSLWRALRWLPALDDVICLPAIGPRLQSTQLAGATPGALPKAVPSAASQGDNLAGLRLWRSADGRRSIAWRASERAGTLLAREWSQPADQARALVIDPRLPEASTVEEAYRLFDALLAAAFDWAQREADVAVLFYAESQPRELRFGRSDTSHRRSLALFAQQAPIAGPKGLAALDQTLAMAREKASGRLLACVRVDAQARSRAQTPGSALSFLPLDFSSLTNTGDAAPDGGSA